MKLAQHFAQCGRDALGQEDRDARTDAQELHMRDGAQPAQQGLQFLVTQEERIPSTQQHVADGGGAPDVINLRFEVGMEVVACSVANEPGAGAVAAIAGAAVRDQE